MCLGCEDANPQEKVLRWEGVVGTSLSPSVPVGSGSHALLPPTASGFLVGLTGQGAQASLC